MAEHNTLHLSCMGERNTLLRNFMGECNTTICLPAQVSPKPHNWALLCLFVFVSGA
jgi:hypothetical protein